MIVVFVIDTSPSMGLSINQKPEESKNNNGMSRLDLAKMVVEGLEKGLDKRILEYNKSQPQQQLLYPPDQFLLLSTGKQDKQPGTITCGAGGRLLVGYNDTTIEPKNTIPTKNHQHGTFEQSLKHIKLTTPYDDDDDKNGLNLALSTGLSLLSKYRLKHKSIENFGMGLYPNNIQHTTSSCIILVSDGDSNDKAIQLQFGLYPLREFYKEPFRWDQRFFCINVGNKSIHSSLRALCEVTGGGYVSLGSVGKCASVVEGLLRQISPMKVLPIIDPLQSFIKSQAKQIYQPFKTTSGVFVNGGPVCTFSKLDTSTTNNATIYRAMLLYVPSQQVLFDNALIAKNANYVMNTTSSWCIPESYFPNKKLDTLPPRTAQPILSYCKNFNLSFDPYHVIKLLHHLDKLQTSNKQLLPSNQQIIKLLPRDVYLCEWIRSSDEKNLSPYTQKGQEYLPISIKGASRDDTPLHIGILHIPCAKTNSTLTLLPPNPHILLPLLISAAEVEYHTIKKSLEKNKDEKAIVNAIHGIKMHENWISKFKSYLYRIPTYYILSIRRSLKPILPTCVHPLLSFGHKELVVPDANLTMDSIALMCFSRNCYNKIRQGELVAKQENERVERQEEEVRRRGCSNPTAVVDQDVQLQHGEDMNVAVGYGQYDPRSSVSSYLSSLRSMPPPWRVVNNQGMDVQNNTQQVDNSKDIISVTETLGELPAKCLLAYYESRRRWIHGGPSLTTKGISVEGVDNDGENVHIYTKDHTRLNESLLSIAGVGASNTHVTPITKMGDYRERLLFSHVPIVGYGGSSMTACSAATIAADGSPQWSVDDASLPHAFFDKNGQFSDCMQTRVKARLMIHFGNPFKDKRGDAIVPEMFLYQRPPGLHNRGSVEDSIGATPPGSPPRDEDDLPSVEGEGEAEFAGKVPSPPRNKSDTEDNTGVKRKGLSLDGKEQPTKKAATHKPAPPSKPPPPPNQHQASDKEENSRSINTSPIPPPPKSSSMITQRLKVVEKIANQPTDKNKKLEKEETKPPPPAKVDEKIQSSDNQPSTQTHQETSTPSVITQRLKGTIKTKPQPPPPTSQENANTFSVTPSIITTRLKTVETKTPPQQESYSSTPSIITSRLKSPTPPTPKEPQKVPLSPKPPPPPIAPSVLSKRLKVSNPPKLQVGPSMLSARLGPVPSQPKESTIASPPPKPPSLNVAPSILSQRLAKDTPAPTQKDTPAVAPSALSERLAPKPPNPDNSLKTAPSMLSARLKTPQNPPPAPPKTEPPSLSLSPSILSQRLKAGPTTTPQPPPQPTVTIAPSMLSERLSRPQQPTLSIAPSMLSERLTRTAPQQDLQNPDVKPKVNLPAGWICVWSKSQKRWYFFDTRSNKSVWQWPPPKK